MVYKLNVDIFKIWKPYTFPSPIAVAKTLITLISNNTLGIAIVVSLRRLVIGYFISLVIGVAIGLLIVRYKYIDEK